PVERSAGCLERHGKRSPKNRPPGPQSVNIRVRHTARDRPLALGSKRPRPSSRRSERMPPLVFFPGARRKALRLRVARKRKRSAISSYPGYPMSDIKYVSDSSFELDVLKASGPVLVDYWAEWCGPCRAIAPLVAEIAKDYDGRLTV